MADQQSIAINNIKFVKEVEKRPCLYNHTLMEFSRKDLTEAAWNEVAREVNLTVGRCKEKWKNLRAVLVRHLKPSSTKKRPYYLTDAMRFTVPYIKSLNREYKTVSVDKLPTLSAKNEDFDSEDNEEEEEDLQRFVFQRCPSYSSPSPQPQPSVSPSSPSPQTKINPKKCKENFDTSNGTMIADVSEINEYFHAKKAKIEISSEVSKESKKMFLLSLLPDVNVMSDAQMRTFKRGVLNLIGDILEDVPSTSS